MQHSRLVHIELFGRFYRCTIRGALSSVRDQRRAPKALSTSKKMADSLNVVITPAEKRPCVVVLSFWRGYPISTSNEGLQLTVEATAVILFRLKMKSKRSKERNTGLFFPLELCSA